MPLDGFDGAHPNKSNDENSQGPPKSSETDPPSKPKEAPRGPEIDHAELPVDFDPCGYFHTRVAELSANGSIAAELASGSVFAGGFTLSTSTNHELALPETEYIGGFTSHRRRCFLMPLYLGDTFSRELATWRAENKLKALPRRDGGGHHLLAVVQEETDDDESRFDVRFYDSSNDMFSDSHEFLASAVQYAIDKLQWSTHRNPDDHIELVYETYQDLPQQVRGGGWRCGPHTVINDWILAMGLTPKPKAKFPSVVYEEFSLLARAAVAGLLDRKTLVAWFFCRKLTIERRLEAGLPDRRFQMTQFWQDEVQLYDRIHEILLDDELLGERPIDEARYDHGNNQRNALPDSYIYSDDEKTEKDEDESDEEDLARCFEEPDRTFASHLTTGYGKRSVSDALNFLDGYDLHSDGDVIMGGAGRRATITGESIRDNLVFLGGFQFC